MSTRSPDIAELDDYLHAGLQAEEASELEARLFEAAQTAEDGAAQFLHMLQERATWLAEQMQFGESHTRAHIDALLARDPSVHYVALHPEQVEIPIWKPGTTRVVFHTRVDLRGYEHVEFSGGLRGAEPLITFRDVAFDPKDGNTYTVCFEPLARLAFGAGRLHWRVTGQRDGKRETVAELTLELVTRDR